ncbi:hypothetical protein E5S70_13050 [Ensifer adhaerens]|nr:hypothetical protein [Ensifer canadensis]NOV16993.1 hypothetical protein [Ensifer canadensis]
MTSRTEQMRADRSDVIDVEMPPYGLPGSLRVPPNSRGVIIFAHGSRSSPRNVYIAEAFRRRGLGDQVSAVVPGGGRAAAEAVTTPTLLIVGGRDHDVLGLNRSALAMLGGPKKLHTVPGATHLFSEPGALDAVISTIAACFDAYCRQRDDEQERRWARALLESF